MKKKTECTNRGGGEGRGRCHIKTTTYKNFNQLISIIIVIILSHAGVE